MAIIGDWKKQNETVVHLYNEVLCNYQGGHGVKLKSLHYMLLSEESSIGNRIYSKCYIANVNICKCIYKYVNFRKSLNENVMANGIIGNSFIFCLSVFSNFLQ